MGPVFASYAKITAGNAARLRGLGKATMAIDGDGQASDGKPAHNLKDNLVKTRVAPDLAELLKPEALTARPADETLPVIIELDSNFPGGTRAARQLLFARYWTNHPSPDLGTLTPPVLDTLAQVPPLYQLVIDLVQSPVGDGQPFAFAANDQLDFWKSMQTEVFIFGILTAATIMALADVVATTRASKTPPRASAKIALVHKLWRDHAIQSFVYESVRTIKCDAARAAFGSAGEGIVWAVADTGIKGDHPHFLTHETLKLPNGLQHCDFTATYANFADAGAGALVDTDGHGTHVAGIIAGETFKVGSPGAPDVPLAINSIEITHQVRGGDGETTSISDISRVQLSGIAPRCKLLSLKVLGAGQDNKLAGNVSNLLAAVGYVQQVNNYGRDIKIHGLNLSLGYPFDAAWFAAGQSPLCAEVNRLVKCGVIVVVAAGNAGYGRVATSSGTSEAAALPCTIADPANADLAITVGSTHRSKPHAFGVSYFSAKGPTADGRMKPDLVAPGERIVSCSIGASATGAALFREDSGTSMAAPHVSGAAAAFLSVRGEFIGQAETVKTIFLQSSVDLKRRAEFQGAGLIDLMKALQSI
jgi:serine protease AprX